MIASGPQGRTRPIKLRFEGYAAAAFTACFSPAYAMTEPVNEALPTLPEAPFTRASCKKIDEFSLVRL